jgi:hypothetical protein
MDNSFFIIAISLHDNKIYNKYQRFNENYQTYTTFYIKNQSASEILKLLQTNCYLTNNLSQSHYIYLSQELVKSEFCLLFKQQYIQL